MSAPPSPSGRARMPQPTPQYGHVVRTAGGCCGSAFMPHAPSLPRRGRVAAAGGRVGEPAEWAIDPTRLLALLAATLPFQGRDGVRGTARDEPSRASIHVLLIAAALLEVGHEGDRLVGRAHAVLRDDVDQRPFHVLGHALGVAAHIHMRAVGEPRPQIAADLAHAILHVEFLLAVARPGERETGQHTGRLHAGELVLVEKIVVAALVPEE